MIIYLVSGDGQGAGKTTLAEKLVGKSRVWSIAGSLRGELSKKYPAYNWYAKEQAYKNTTLIKEFAGKTMREVMVEYGQGKCEKDPCYWVSKIVDALEQARQMPTFGPIAIDDVRKMCELELLKERFPQALHFHVTNPRAVAEPQYNNHELWEVADYVVDWQTL